MSVDTVVSLRVRIYSRIKPSRIDLANIFRKTVYMYQCTYPPMKNKNTQELFFSFSILLRLRERKFLSREHSQPSQILKRPIEKKRNVPSLAKICQYIRMRKDSHATGHTCLSKNFIRDTKLFKYSYVRTISRETCFRKTSHRTNKPLKTPSFRLRGIFTSETHTLRM